MIKAILFDVDGTLLDSKDYLLEAFNLALSDIGERGIGREVFFGMVKRNFDNTLGYYISNILKKPEKEKALTLAFIKQYLTMIEEKLELLPGTDQTWKRLKDSGIKIGILTNQYRVMLDIFLNKFSLIPDAYITREDVQNKKPDGEGIRKLCDALGVGIEDVLVVGDWTGDVLAAKDAGARAVAVLSGVSRKEDLELAGADEIIEDVNCLPGLLERL